jgi:site-specific recombinase XerD
MTKLRERMIRDMQARNYSQVTQDGYVRAVMNLARYHRRSPDQLGTQHIEDYVAHLLGERKVRIGTCHAVITGIRFFYLVTLKRDPRTVPVPPMRKVTRLPEILSAQELERLFAAATLPKHRALLMIAYGAGLRVGELVQLKLTDIHSDRMMIHVEQGKGRKDRYTLLSERLLAELRAYWKAKHPEVWLFPGNDRTRPMTKRAAQKAYTMASQRARLKRRGGIHTLRHCFATHLMEAGVDVRTIQLLMGHASILTTMRYLQVTQKKLEETQCPLDLLAIPTDKADLG